MHRDIPLQRAVSQRRLPGVHFECGLRAHVGASLPSQTLFVVLELNPVELPIRFFDKAAIAIKIASSTYE